MKETVSRRKRQDWDNKKKLRRIWLFLFLFTLCLVWGNSLLSREDSGAVSDWVRQLLETIFGNETPAAQFILVKIRKIAHFLEYSVLGIEAVLFTFLARPVSGQGVFNCTALGLMAATIDESIQIFAGRGAMVQDILLDMSGFLLAGGITLGILISARRIRGKSVEEKNL